MKSRSQKKTENDQTSVNRFMSFTFSSTDSTLRDSTIQEFGRSVVRRVCEPESGAPIIQPITRNLKLSQGSLPMKSQLCSHQHINLPYRIHQSLSSAALRCHLMLPTYLSGIWPWSVVPNVGRRDPLRVPTGLPEGPE